MTKELLNKIAKRLNVNFEWANPEHTQVKIAEDGHKGIGLTERKMIGEAISAIDPTAVKRIEEHTKKPYLDALKTIPPVGYLFYACDELDTAQIVDSILNAPADAEIIINQVKEENFVATLFRCYEKLVEAKAAPTATEFKDKTLTIPTLGSAEESMLNRVFEGYKIPEWRTLVGAVSDATTIAEQAKALQKALNKTVADSKAEAEALQKVISQLKENYESKKYENIEAVASGVIPSGKVVMRKVKDLFPGVTEAEFTVPSWEWDGVHPEVPAKDPFYIFREELLLRALYAIESNQRMYLQGHTGSGKTTLIEQIAAHLNWPFKRINFDSEITRMDLIGRDTLKDGASVFVDGMLPQMMQGPYIGVFDEIDICRPDVAYVMQSVLEGNSFRITEDGGREVKPNPMFRMFATGNTVGQGDEHGMYQGARPQSLAFLDRFTIWGKVEYLKDEERKTLIKRHFPMLSDAAVTTINKYATEHLAAFENAKILQPISPRGILAVARATVHFRSIYENDNKAIKAALTMSILDRCTASDHATIVGVIDRVVK